jgi:nucleoside-diphosphate-sugar epimerase
VTGGSGFLGKAFVKKMLEKGETVYCLSRHPLPGERKLIGLRGDILEYDLGLDDVPEGISALYHIAGVVSLAKHDNDGSIWKTNAIGTENVIKFCWKYKIPHLYYVSSAFANPQGCNPYEKSKAAAEKLVRESGIAKTTIFKPSIILGPADHCHLEHLSQFAVLMARIHKRADLIRRLVEGTLHLPVLEPVFHFRGNPEGKLNIVPLGNVVRSMTILNIPGTFWLTHNDPPTVGEVANWIGEAILLRVIVSTEFNRTPIEFAFERLAAPFRPYLQGREFPSDISCPIIKKEAIIDMVLGCFKP